MTIMSRKAVKPIMLQRLSLEAITVPPPYPNANANGYENANDTDNDYANVGGQIIHDFHPVQNIIDRQLAIDGLMDGFPRNGYNWNQSS